LKDNFQATLRKVLENDLPEARKSWVLTEGRVLVEEACEWIKEHKEVKAWEESLDNRLLWLSGSPGKGKTSMALYLTGELEKNWRRDATDGRVLHILLYYFFRRGSTTIHALGSLLWSLFIQAPTNLQSHILGKYEEQRESLFEFEPLCNLFKEMADLNPCQGEIRCIIDGLDECENFPGRGNMLLLFVEKISRLFNSKLHPHSPQKLTYKIFLISRPIAPLKNQLADIPRMDLDADMDAQLHLQKSIDTFVRGVMSQGQIRSWKDGSLRQKVTEYLLERAVGTYIWVGPLAKAVSIVEARESDLVLPSLPDSLVDFYSRMLPPPAVKESYRILGYVAVSHRPLKLEELAVLTNIPPQAIEESTKSRMEINVESCGQLLKFHQATSTVALIHESAKDFLLGRGYSLTDGQSPPIAARKANAEMGSACLAIVMEWAKEVASQNLVNASQTTTRSPLLDYAIEYWLQHYSHCEVSDVNGDSQAWDNLTNFGSAKYSRKRRVWLAEYWSRAIPSPRLATPEHFEMIHAAAFFGVAWLVRYLVQKGRGRLNLATSSGMTSLHWAARNRHLEVVKVLFEFPSVNLEAEGYKMTPLIWAVHNKQHDIVEFLLQKKARIDAVGFGMTALHWAVWVQDKRMIALLLKTAEKDEKHLEARTVLVETARLLPGSQASNDNRPSAPLSWVLPRARMLLTKNIMSESEIYKRNIPQTKKERETVAQDMEMKKEKAVQEMRIRRGEKTVVVFAMSVLAIVAMICLLATIAWKASEPLFQVVGWKTEKWLSVIVSFLISWSLVAGLWWRGQVTIASKMGVATSAAWAGFTTGWAALCSFAFAMGEGPAIVELRAAPPKRTESGSLLAIASKQLASSFKKFTHGRDGYIPPPTFEDIVKKASLVLLQGTMRWVFELIAWAFALILGLWWTEKGGSHSVVWALLLTSWVLVVVWEATIGLATATKAEDTSAWILIATGSITMTVAAYSSLAGVLATLGQGRPWRSKLRYASGTVLTSCTFAVGFVAIEPIPRLKDKIPLKSIGLTSLIISVCLAVVAAIVAEIILRCLEAGKDIWYHIRCPDFKYGHTPLHLAALTGNKTTVEMLLKAGANPWAQDSNTLTAYWLAKKSCFRDVEEVLEEAMNMGPKRDERE
jgi:ankyrin repeat protein